MRVRRLIPLVALVAALLAPTSAHAGLGWHDAGTGAPGTVAFNDVTRWEGSVVAVGRDGQGADAVPAIYRLTGDTWSRDLLKVESGAPAVKGELFDVAGNATGLWAVGATDTGAPLLVRLAPAGTDATPTDGPREWDVLATPAGMDGLRSVAVSATVGYAGDVQGELWPIHGAATDPASTPREVAVNGIALTATAAYAVTDGGLAEDRIFTVTGRTAKSELAVPDSDGRPVVAVASGPAGLLAADDRGYWLPDARGVWQRASSGLTTSSFAVGDVQLADVSVGTGVTALGGKVAGTAAGGYVWHGAVGSWKVDKVSAAPIHGVAAYAAQDVWAAGANGVLLHYFHKPDPAPDPDPDPDPDPVCTQNCGGDTGGGSHDGGAPPAPSNNTSTNTTTTTIPPAKKGDPTVFVVEPKKPATRKRSGKRRARQRLVDRVKVLRRHRRLVVTFRLRAPARVALSAKRGRAVVSRARSRAMRPGRRRVVLPFRGKPPTQLRIVVRPLRAKRA